jgi:hypothetical protein
VIVNLMHRVRHGHWPKWTQWHAGADSGYRCLVCKREYIGG